MLYQKISTYPLQYCWTEDFFQHFLESERSNYRDYMYKRFVLERGIRNRISLYLLHGIKVRLNDYRVNFRRIAMRRMYARTRKLRASESKKRSKQCASKYRTQEGIRAPTRARVCGARIYGFMCVIRSCREQ